MSTSLAPAQPHASPHSTASTQQQCHTSPQKQPTLDDTRIRHHWHTFFSSLTTIKAALLPKQVRHMVNYPQLVIPKMGLHYLVRHRPQHRGPSQQSGAQRGGQWPWLWQPQWRRGALPQPWGSRSPAAPPLQTQSPAPTPGSPRSCATASPDTPSPTPTTTCLSMLQPLHCSKELLCRPVPTARSITMTITVMTIMTVTVK